jgi:glycosyltransferase involved in cell wall biosynthesis
MKVYFNRMLRRSAWGGGALFMANMVDYLQAHGEQISTSLYDNDIDIIFMLDPRPEDGGCSIFDIVEYKRRHPNVKVLHRLNDTDKHRGTNVIDDLLLKSNQHANATVFISKWLQGYYTSKGFNRPSHVITNGCNESVYYPATGKKFEKPFKLVTHHWSDNYNKGFDVYNWLDQLQSTSMNGMFEFTYVGRYWHGYKPTSTRIIAPMYGKVLGDELRKHDIYVTASRWEACGAHHIEGSRSGLPVLYHRDGGGICEICSNHGIQYNDETTFIDALLELIGDYEAYRRKINYDVLGSNHCCNLYYEVLRSML